MRKLFKVILPLVVVFISIFDIPQISAQNTTQREEVQRYFGYEILPYRYLSLPYDVSVNANEKGVFVDISCLYLIFLPLFLVVYLLRWKVLALIFFICNLLGWVIGTSNSYVYSYKLRKSIPSEADALVDYLLGEVNFWDEPAAHITAYLYYVTSFIYKPLLTLVQPISGESDYVTYPFLIGLFLVGIFLLDKILKDKSTLDKAPFIVYAVFLFFWFKYSAGIPWYGFFFFFMSLMMISLFIERENKEYHVVNTFLKYAFYGLSSIYILSAILYRVGDVNSGLSKKTLGTTMFSPQFFAYQAGQMTEDELLDAFYPNFRPGLELMNSDLNSNILRIGTSFTYFIKNNSSRVKIDNQLGLFDRLNTIYQGDQNVISDVLLASNVKFLIIDVNTPYIDRTPEQTLKKKYDRLMKYVRGNPRLKLLGTNRSYYEQNPSTRKRELVFQMFPSKERGSKIVYGGQYAIYQIQ